jgi:hypothetical protein
VFARKPFVALAHHLARCLAVLPAAALLACASTPADQLVDRLDPDTATTVTVVAQPVQLITETPRGGAGDPFAYVAPFETDRAGTRDLYLWVSAPQNTGPIDTPKLLCDGRILALKSIPSDLSQIQLAKPPYSVPGPFSSQWYYALPRESLDCLGTAQGITIETAPLTGEVERFSASGKTLSALKAFANHSTN